MKRKDDYSQIGKILIDLRTEKRVSLRDLAKFCDIQFNRLSRLESGKYEITFSELRKLSIFYSKDLYADLTALYASQIDLPLILKKQEVDRKNGAWLAKKVFFSQEEKDAYEKAQAVNDSQIDDVDDEPEINDYI